MPALAVASAFETTAADSPCPRRPPRRPLLCTRHRCLPLALACSARRGCAARGPGGATIGAVRP
eukprot:6312891-Prymnesium_polylepis.1